ncbi:MAG: DUF1015 domain-containing protein [Chitinivibrionales bacterium]
MAEITSFSGFRYALDKPHDLGALVCPPYDMVDKNMIEQLYAKDPHNAVRLIQNRPEDGDSANKDRHARAAMLLQQWIENGTLSKENAPAIYQYRQRFTIDGETFTRTGFVARIKLVEFSEGVVFPHEYTLSGPKRDRFELLEATHCNTGQIFGLVPDEGELYQAIESISADTVGAFTDATGVEHQLAAVTDQQTIEKLQRLMQDRMILIADGHHRYETSLEYARTSSRPGAEYVMMTLVSMADPGLVIRPFHRVVKRNDLTAPFTGIAELKRFFDTTDLGETDFSIVDQFLSTSNEFEMIFLDRLSGRLYGLNTNAGGQRYLKENAEGMSDRWNQLMVSKINRLCVGGIMKQPLDGAVLHDVMDYSNDASRTYERVLSDEGVLGAFFIKPVDIDTVRDIVKGGERMPQKSTNFYPKLFSGLVFNKLDA